MIAIEKVLFTWSGGRDSALALYELQRKKDYEISALLTTITAEYNRICMHGLRQILLERQANALNLRLEKVFISKDVSNEEYECKIQEILKKYQEDGKTSVAYGDIFLEDIREYREKNLSKLGIRGIFPLWKKNTNELAHKFINLGFKAIIICIDSKTLNKSFVGRIFDEQFLSDLPSTVNPCGENGEFHSFVFDGPIFKKKILFKKGKIVFRDNRFYYCDLLPK
jgi:uncharacterized protein (TIGR00290 family)